MNGLSRGPVPLAILDCKHRWLRGLATTFTEHR